MAGKNKLLLVVPIALIVTAAIAVCAVVFWKDKPEEAVLTSPTAEPVEAIEAEPEENGVAIKTKYVTLYYPEEFAEDVMIVYADNDTGSEITVMSEISGAELELYTMILSTETVDGYKIGSLKLADGNLIGVYMRMNEQSAADWSEEDFERINLLQTTVNDLMMQIYDKPDFIAEQ